MKKNIFIACAGLLLISYSPLKAQIAKKDTTLNRTVVVEREYNPVVESTTKVNVLPRVEEPNITPKKVEYDFNAVQPRSYSVSLVNPMVAPEVEQLSKLGYLRFGFGNYGNLDARGHYTFLMSPKDRLTLDFTSYGMSGKLDQYYSKDAAKWDAFYYRTFGSIAYEHQFNAATLKLKAGYKVNNFNFADLQNVYIPKLGGGLDANKQRFNSGDFTVGVKSTDKNIFIKYDVESQFRIYQRQYDFIKPELKETSLNTTAKLRTDIDTDNAIGLDLAMFNRVISGSDTKNSTTFDMNPYYGLTLDNWKFRLGAHIDLGFSHGESFLVAPDVSAELTLADHYKLYAKATGGRIKSDFTRMEELAPYTLINKNNRDSYEQLNASLGFQGSPINGMWFTIYGGYQKLKDDLFQEINQIDFPATVFANADTKNAYVGAKVQYDYKKIFDFSVATVYRNWTSKSDLTGAILFKPKFDLEADFRLHPIQNLTLGVNYKFVKRNDNKDLDIALSVGDINKLSAYATYEFVKNLSVYAKMDNIFNKKYQYFYGYPIEGTNFIAGLSFKF